MALTADQIAGIRDFIGDAEPPDDFDLSAIYDRVGGLTHTALTVVDRWIADLAKGNPISFSISGELSVNRAENLKALQEIRRRIVAEGVGDEGPLTGYITIGSVRRRWAR